MTTPEDPSDRLIDSLLREQARRRAADEELIASIHAALDGAGGGSTARMKKSTARMGLLLASAAAVVLAAGGIALNRRGNEKSKTDLAMEPATVKTPEMRRERLPAVVAEKRPAAEARAEAGEWEGDLLKFPPEEKELAIKDPSDAYFQGYLLAQDAEKLKADGLAQKALEKYQQAQAIFSQIQKQYPEWRQEMIAGRLEKNREMLNLLAAKEGALPSDGALAGNDTRSVAEPVEAAPAAPISRPAAAVPMSKGTVRFLAWDGALAAKNIDMVSGGQSRLIGGLHPLKRTPSYKGADPGEPLMLWLEGRLNPDGGAAMLEVKTDGIDQPTVLIIANEKVPSGLAAVVINDEESNFKWGSYQVFNATAGDIALVVDKVAVKVPTGWRPVPIIPKGVNHSAAIEMRTYKDPSKVVYSSVWPAEPDARLLIILCPSTDPAQGPIATKTVPETKSTLLAEQAGRYTDPAGPEIAVNQQPLPIVPSPGIPRPGMSLDTGSSGIRRQTVEKYNFEIPIKPSEALADAELPPTSDAANGLGGSGGGSGRAVGTSSGPGRGTGAGIEALVDRASPASVSAKAKALSDDAGWGTSRSFDKVPGIEGANGERYGQLVDQPWKSPWQDALSTFSIDVDAASYTNIRRMIRAGVVIPPDAVRIEECLNYFDYRYEGPKGNGPFAVMGTLVKSPLQEGHLLARVAIKGREIQKNARPASNLVFLIDVSGSMQDTMKLPLLQRSLELLVDQLDERDRVGIVVYAGNEGVVLDSTQLSGEGKTQALRALKKLEAGGSTNGGAGIKRAYEMAASHFIPGGVNRVILATDGDFNVGTTNQNDLVELVKEKAKSGVNLTVTSFGDGNLNDSMLEAITKDGNGNYYYIDSDNEGRRIFLEKLTGTLVTIAKDVKIQVEFNPGKVKAYRLLGYADRILKHEDFNNDKVDAGDIGAGHTVTALYEIVPQGAEMPNLGGVDPLRYQKPEGREVVASEEWMTLKLRYKAPDGDVSSLVETPLKGEPQAWEESGNDMRFASAVALFGMKLRGMPEAKEVPWGRVIELAKPALADDPQEQRAEFVELVKKLAK